MTLQRADRRRPDQRPSRVSRAPSSSRQMEKAHGRRGEPVHRARMSNLIIHCNSAERSADVEAMIPEIVARSPRARLCCSSLIPRIPRTRSRHRSWSARPGRRRSSSPSRSPSAPVRSRRITCRSRVRGLVIGDLPTNVWWTNPIPPALAGPILDAWPSMRAGHFR